MIRMLTAPLVLFLTAALGAAEPAGDQLPRRGSLGLGVRPSADGPPEVAVVRPGGPAERAGVRLGDRLVSLHGKPVVNNTPLPELIRTVPGGGTVEIRLTRDGNDVTLQAVLDTMPAEVAPASTVSYSSVAVPAGYRLRTIITMPAESPIARDGRVPGFLFIQGLQCSTLDRPTNLDAPDTRLVHAMARAGYATLRVDKPGLGDSQGPPCGDIDFAAELEGYKAALRQLRALPGVDPERLYIFGHSMGGVMAPYVMLDSPVRGAIVYGTATRTWFEYQLENTRRQLELSGASEADITDALINEARFSSMVLVEKKTPADVWERFPELRSESPMIEPRRMFTRDIAFFHQLQDRNISRGWEQSGGAVLAIHGEYDWVTSPLDHEMIARIVNARTPGQGRFLSIPGADHGFTVHDSLQDSVRALGQGRWDGSIAHAVLAWIDQLEGRAPAGDLLPAAGERGAAPGGGRDPKPGAASVAAASAQPGTAQASPLTAPPTARSKPVELAAASAARQLPDWQILRTERYPGKQDDIFFISPDTGWYVNGAGKIFRTSDGGESWGVQLREPGTYFRCIAFVDENVGIAGNIGPGYFPNVSDPTPIYRTADGGKTWAPISAPEGSPLVGLCSLEILREEHINAGNLDTRTRIIGTGRVGGPALLVCSDDLGKSWSSIDLSPHAAMTLDVHFFDRSHGVLAAASDADTSRSNALILTTADGGKTWTRVYQSTRPYELTWKISFPSRQVGYVTIQSCNPDPAASARYVAKTTDGGKTWTELPLIDDHKVRQFGIAFIDEDRGWIGAMPNGFQTTDGGRTWLPADFGTATNKVRLLPTPTGTHAFAIGVSAARTFVPAVATP